MSGGAWYLKRFKVEGEFKAGRRWERFTKEVSSLNEKNAVEEVYSLIGSKHCLKRNLVRINAVQEQ